MTLRAQVLALGIEDDLRRAIQESVSASHADYQESDALPPRTAIPTDATEQDATSNPPDVLIVGPAVQEPLKVLQAAHRLNDRVRAVLIANDEDHAQVRAHMFITPHIGIGARCIARSQHDEIKAAVKAAVDAASAHRHFRSRYDRSEGPARERPPTQGKAAATLLHRILEATPVGIIVLDRHRRIVTWTRAAASMMGSDPHRALGREISTYFSTQEGRDLERLIEKTMASVTAAPVPDEGQPIPAPRDLRPPTITISRTIQEDSGANRRRDLEVAATPMDISSHEAGTILTLRDVTDARRVEQLRVDKAAAEAAAKVRAEFLANMSHEIRTPLNAIIGLTALLADTRLDPEQRDYVNTIETSGEHLLGLINDILDLSKLDAGKLKLGAETFRMHEVVEQALEIIAPQVPQRDVEIVHFVDERIPPGLVGDPVRIRQILVNILGNAAKFTESGEIQVVVRSLIPTKDRQDTDQDRPEQKAMSRDGPRALDLIERIPIAGQAKGAPGHATITPSAADQTVEIVVRDTGIGMEQAQIERLFEAFEQADTSASRKHGGTGLGLTITARLVNLMGGQIRVASNPDEGTEFIVTLPLPPGRLVPEPWRHDHQVLQGRHAVIIDDNQTNLDIFTHHLRRWGMVVTTYDDPREYRREAQAAKDDGFLPDVFIVDHNMPGLTGTQLLAELESHFQRPMPTSLLLSSGIPNEAQVDALKTQILSAAKAVKDRHLHAMLQRALSESLPPVSPDEDASRTIPSDHAQRYPLKLLLAEDNQVNTLVTTRILQRLGYACDIAVDGEDAVDTYEAKRPQVILMDIQMPHMDGIEATKAILAKGHEPAPYIIGLTAHAGEEARRECLKAGMKDHVSKPVTVDQLTSALRRAHDELEGSRPEHTSSSDGDGKADGPVARVARSQRIDVQLFDEDDLKALTRLDPGDNSFLEEMVTTIVNLAPDQLKELRSAREQGDRAAIARAAHGIVGSARAVAAREMGRLASQLEREAAQLAPESLDERLAELEATVWRTLEALPAAYDVKIDGKGPRE